MYEYDHHDSNTLRCTSMITMTAIPDRILLSYRDPESFECNAKIGRAHV